MIIMSNYLGFVCSQLSWQLFILISKQFSFLQMDLFSLLTMNAATNPAFNQPVVFPNSSPLPELEDVFKVNGGQKRKRLRRHPVWQYFGDIADKVSIFFGNIKRRPF